MNLFRSFLVFVGTIIVFSEAVKLKAGAMNHLDDDVILRRGHGAA